MYHREKLTFRAKEDHLEQERNNAQKGLRQDLQIPLLKSISNALKTYTIA